MNSYTDVSSCCQLTIDSGGGTGRLSITYGEKWIQACFSHGGSVNMNSVGAV